MHRILIIAFHFPPQSGSSGLLRSLKLSRYLPQHGWIPTVLTLNRRAYERMDSRPLAEVPAEVTVYRAFALDTPRHLSLWGRYLRCMALPDRWVTWCVGAVPLGWWVIHRKKIEVIFSTFPVASAVLIGLSLRRLTRKPWVVDFRDSMTEDQYPRDPWTWRFWRWIERQAIRHGSRFVFTAPGTRDMYLKRYRSLSPQDCLLLPNGYDEEDFKDLSRPGALAHQGSRPLRLLHGGLVYPKERDPEPLFRALAQLKSEKVIDSSSLIVDLRAPGSERQYADLLRELDIADIVRLLPPLPYRDLLRECAQADGLLLLQASSCNHQIPAKAYEYLRLGKPILALTSAEGDTAALLQSTGGATVIDLADEQAIHAELPSFLQKVLSGTHSHPDSDKVKQYSRWQQARELAKRLDELVEG